MKATSPQPSAARSRDAGQTRARILAAARARFSQHSYENVGTRDIAGDAGVDAALVSRYFGSKDRLFAAVIEGGFDVDEHLPARLDDLGRFLTAQILGAAEPSSGFDALRVLLHAAGSPAVAAMVSQRFHAEFVKPLARRLRGPDADVRAALIASYVIGIATMRHGLHSTALTGPARRRAAAIAAAAIQACVD